MTKFASIQEMHAWFIIGKLCVNTSHKELKDRNHSSKKKKRAGKTIDSILHHLKIKVLKTRIGMNKTQYHKLYVRQTYNHCFTNWRITESMFSKVRLR